MLKDLIQTIKYKILLATPVTKEIKNVHGCNHDSNLVSLELVLVFPVLVSPVLV